LQNQFDRQQLQDAERDGAARGQHAEKIPRARPHHCKIGRERMRVDDGGDSVGGVVKAVDEFEPECDQQRDAEQQIRKHGTFTHRLQVAHQLRAAIADAHCDHGEENHEAEIAPLATDPTGLRV